MNYAKFAEAFDRILFQSDPAWSAQKSDLTEVERCIRDRHLFYQGDYKVFERAHDDAADVYRWSDEQGCYVWLHTFDDRGDADRWVEQQDKQAGFGIEVGP